METRKHLQPLHPKLSHSITAAVLFSFPMRLEATRLFLCASSWEWLNRGVGALYTDLEFRLMHLFLAHYRHVNRPRRKPHNQAPQHAP